MSQHEIVLEIHLLHSMCWWHNSIAVAEIQAHVGNVMASFVNFQKVVFFFFLNFN